MSGEWALNEAVRRCDGATVRDPKNDRSTEANEGNEGFSAGEQLAFWEAGANSRLSPQWLIVRPACIPGKFLASFPL
jgi:hypothetical protein